MAENEKSTLENIIVAGVDAITKTAESAGAMLEELVKKGAITVEQGKALNEELKYGIKEKVVEKKEAVKSSAVSGFIAQMDKFSPEDLVRIREKLDELENTKGEAVDE